MSIRAKLQPGTTTVSGGRVVFYVACDFCREEIQEGEPANIDTGLEDDAETFMLHKRCSRRFNAERDAKGLDSTRWSELHGVKIDAS